MLSNLKHEAVATILGLESIQDRRQMIFELHVDNGADDLTDLTRCTNGFPHRCCRGLGLRCCLRRRGRLGQGRLLRRSLCCCSGLGGRLCGGRSLLRGRCFRHLFYPFRPFRLRMVLRKASGLQPSCA